MTLATVEPEYLIREDGPKEWTLSKWEMDKEPSAVYQIYQNGSGALVCDCPKGSRDHTGTKHSSNCKHVEILQKWLKSGKKDGLITAGPPDNCVVWRMPMNLEDTKPEDLEESPVPDAAESKKDKNEEDDYLAEKKAKEKRMLSKIEAFLDTNQIDPEQMTTGDLQCLVLAFSVRDEAERIYQSEPFKEILAGACEDFPNYNNDIEDLSGVMDVTLAEARDEFASDYEHPEWLMIAGELASMLHGGLT